MPDYPPTVPDDLVEDLHGYRVADPYRWLEDAGGERTRDWLAAQDAVAASVLSGLPLRDRFAERVGALLGTGTVTPPVWRGERRFRLRRLPGEEHASVLVTEPDGAERVLVDPAATDPDGTTTLAGWQPDKEGRLLAYQLSCGGTEESLLRVLDVATGADVDGPIDRTRYTPVAWLPGGSGFYYVRRLPPDEVPDGEQQHHRRVWFHRLGDPAGDDVMVYGADRDPTSFFGVSVSRDGRWLLVTVSRGTEPRNELLVADLPASGPEQPDLRIVVAGLDARFGPHVGRDGRLYLWTDLDAPRGRLCVTDPADPGPPGTWTTLLPEDPTANLDDYAILDGPLADPPVLLVARTRHAVAEVERRTMAGEVLGAVALPGVGSIGGLGERPEGGHESWLSYTDFVTPPTVLRVDGRTGVVDVWERPPGAVEAPAARSLVTTTRSADGTSVRYFVVAPPDAVDGNGRPTGARPTILYGYGGFGTSMTPGFGASILAWVEAGGVYAVACLRGGGEEGEDWHRAAMGAGRQRSFDDLHAIAEHLLTGGWTTPDRLAISGGSNGGLLVGAALTQRPDLYACVVCSAPLLDMVRYPLTGFGRLWVEEYGDPDDPDALAALLGYSPYHHVRAGVPYPAVLFTVFDSDTRVDPLHARKMCAALQAAGTGAGPVVLRREADVGHGARSISRSVALAADTLAFQARFTGLEVRPDPEVTS